MLKKFNKKLLIFSVIISLIIIFPLGLYAQVDYLDRLTGVGDVAYGTDEPATPQEIIVSIINVFLGLLAIFFLIQILVAGYQWMSAAGNEEKVKHARDRIKSALIGIMIILASLIIVNFVLAQLIGAGGGAWFSFSIGG